MPFLLLLLLALAYLQPQWPAAPEGFTPAHCALVTIVGFEAIFIWIVFKLNRLEHYLQRHPHQRFEVLTQFLVLRRRYSSLILAFFLVSLFGLGWGATVQAFWKRDLGNPPGFELAILTPFFAGVFFGWFANYRLEKLLHAQARHPFQTFPSRGAHLLLNARQSLLLIVPPAALMLVQQTLFYFRPAWETDPDILPWFTAGLVFVALIAVPILIRHFLGLKPLPTGPLRDRLEAAARRLNFRYRDIFVWETRKAVANAMVTGFFPRFRYIILTDRLLDEMTDDEIEAVFGHEVGHIKHRHLIFYMIFMLGSMVGLTVLWSWFDAWLQQPTPLAWLDSIGLGGDFYIAATLPLILLGALYFFVVFGFLSRRCERQADLFGSKATSFPIFISALEKVAVINGISRDKPGWVSSWQHSTIAERVGFLDRVSNDPSLAKSFERRIGWLQGVVASVFLAVLIVWGPSHLATPVNGLAVRVIQK